MATSKCTITGKSYSEATIKANLSKAYKEVYQFEPKGICEGCESEPGICSAHIVGKSRCKHLKITSMIWSPINFFRSCYRCNSVAENVESLEILELKNIERIKEVLENYDPERFNKMI
jgi:hypothetical protein